MLIAEQGYITFNNKVGPIGLSNSHCEQANLLIINTLTYEYTQGNTFTMVHPAEVNWD